MIERLRIVAEGTIWLVYQTNIMFFAGFYTTADVERGRLVKDEQTMALGKRHTRRITVGKESFRWRCDFNEPLERFSASYAERGTTWAPDQLVIRPEVEPHRQLTVIWPACTAPVLKPGFVRGCIEEARRQGWLTTSPVMEMAGSDLDHLSTSD